MPGLYLAIRDDVRAVFDATWAHPDIPVLWRENDLEPMPNPSVTLSFLRNSILFGHERMLAFGGGPGANEKSQFGMVEFVGFTARALVSEDTLLTLLSDAAAAVRSKRIDGSYGAGAHLSFISDGSGFDVDPEERANWFTRGLRMAFEYRFRG